MCLPTGYSKSSTGEVAVGGERGKTIGDRGVSPAWSSCWDMINSPMENNCLTIDLDRATRFADSDVSIVDGDLQ